MNVQPHDGRRYRILELVGRGGFGNVYRARLEGPSGFTKEVALKIVRNQDVPTTEIARFRDEARILGLVRDRAIVAVDPPIRLGTSWAIVMEYVDGSSAQHLVAQAPIPPRAALEIICEIARALHKVYHQLGPDGRPLHLIHRDLKPANIQITPDGDVKLLDFGVARAHFQNREAQTSSSIGGTVGYIAPERLKGVEGPEGDIYSLGILLHVLVTTERATRLGQADAEARFPVPRTPEITAVLALAERMRNPVPAHRPTAMAVENSCAALCASMQGPSLRRWASDAVSNSGTYEPDELVGSLLTETLELSASIERSQSSNNAYRPVEAVGESHRHRWFPLLLASMLFISLVAVAGVGAGIAVASAAWIWPSASQQEPALPLGENIIPQEAPEEIPQEPPDEPEATEPQPAPIREAATPIPAEPSPRAQPKTPAPVIVPAQAPTEEPPPASPPDPVDLVEIVVASEPSGASIYLDGVLIGRTPLRGHPVSSGTYELKLERAGISIVRTVRVGGRRGATSFTWSGEQLVVQ